MSTFLIGLGVDHGYFSDLISANSDSKAIYDL